MVTVNTKSSYDIACKTKSKSLPRFLRSSFAVCTLLFVNSAFSLERPNIVFVVTDDVGLGDIPSNSNPTPLRLPAIQQLANNGIQFTDAHTTAAKCAPSRYSIMTGNYQWRGKYKWGQWNFKGGSQVLPGQQTLGHILSQAGYSTAMIGKYHLGGDFYTKGSNTLARDSTTDDRIDFSRPMINGASELGFQYSYLTLRGIQGSPYAYFENDRLVGSPLDLTHWRVGKYNSSQITSPGIGTRTWDSSQVGPTLLGKALEFIDKNQSSSNSPRPFFLYYNTQAVHGPMTPPVSLHGRRVRGASGIDLRADMLVEIDVVVEQLSNRLERYGITDDTLFILTSDNGALRSSAAALRRGHDSCAGFRGDKGTIYEGRHRVPLVLKWGQHGFRGSPRAAGSTIDNLVGVHDLYATIAELVGVNLAASQGRDSVSILPLLRNTSSRAHRSSMIHQADRTPAKKPGTSYAYRSGDWKLILSKDELPLELYNLSLDRTEKTNVINAPVNINRVQSMTTAFRNERTAARTVSRALVTGR